MRGDDRLMTILTGIVLTVALGAVVQRGDLFSGGEGVAPRDDVATLASGHFYLIDVVANDRGATPADGERLLVTEQPACGTAARSGGSLLYDASAGCEGPQRVSYCLALGDECPSAEVTLVLSGDVETESSASGTPVARLATAPETAVAAVSPAPADSAFKAEPEPERAQGGALAAIVSAFGSLAPEVEDKAAAAE